MPTSISLGSQTVGATSSASSVTISQYRRHRGGRVERHEQQPVRIRDRQQHLRDRQRGRELHGRRDVQASAAGARNATITVTSNGTGSPQAISASGTGQRPAARRAVDDRQSINFGSQTVGVTSAATQRHGHQRRRHRRVRIEREQQQSVGIRDRQFDSCGVLGAGASCASSASRSSPAPPARAAGAFTVVSNGTGSPQAIGVSGTGNASDSRRADRRRRRVPPRQLRSLLHHARRRRDHPARRRAPPFQAGRAPGITFKAYVNATAPAGSAAICRFFNDVSRRRVRTSTRAHGAGCEVDDLAIPGLAARGRQALQYDGARARGGTCPAGTSPVYRLYNHGQGGAPNHRFDDQPGRPADHDRPGLRGRGRGHVRPAVARRKCRRQPRLAP